MHALSNSKNISILAVAILFLFTFFNLILDAPRKEGHLVSVQLNVHWTDESACSCIQKICWENVQTYALLVNRYVDVQTKRGLVLSCTWMWSSRTVTQAEALLVHSCTEGRAACAHLVIQTNTLCSFIQTDELLMQLVLQTDALTARAQYEVDALFVLSDVQTDALLEQSKMYAVSVHSFYRQWRCPWTARCTDGRALRAWTGRWRSGRHPPGGGASSQTFPGHRTRTAEKDIVIISK